MHKATIFPLFYLPPVDYFTALKQIQGDVLLEMHEHFPKQTYRNRASIHSPNGKLDLIVPVEKGAKVHRPMKDIRISYEFNWQRIHWMSLQTSYRSSAFFEFYEDDFAHYYEKKWDYLVDYNQELLTLLIRMLKLNVSFSPTSDYQSIETAVDFRTAIHPKKESLFSPKTYYQVFEDRNGFIKNLSVLDLLFNQGPQSTSHI
ncbi:MAG: WbqC family protein [Sphingobacteriaceae bacterium]